MEATFFDTPAERRTWLQENHDRATELWIGFYKKGADKVAATYPEALDQALCFGWIDGIRKSIDASSFTIRFTPRRPGSIWSNVNIKRVGEFMQLGLMQPSGVAAFERRREDKSGVYSFENKESKLDSSYEAQFRANEKAWSFFEVQAPTYRRAATWWVISPKQEETRLRRLATLIEESAHERRLATLSRTPRV